MGPPTMRPADHWRPGFDQARRADLRLLLGQVDPGAHVVDRAVVRSEQVVRGITLSPHPVHRRPVGTLQ